MPGRWKENGSGKGADSGKEDHLSFRAVNRGLSENRTSLGKAIVLGRPVCAIGWQKNLLVSIC